MNELTFLDRRLILLFLICREGHTTEPNHTSAKLETAKPCLNFNKTKPYCNQIKPCLKSIQTKPYTYRTKPEFNPTKPCLKSDQTKSWLKSNQTKSF